VASPSCTLSHTLSRRATVQFTGSKSLKLTYKNLHKTVSITVAPKEAKFTGEVPTGSGALLEADGPFQALSITDSEEHTGPSNEGK
jgi:hypothetical protein